MYLAEQKRCCSVSRYLYYTFADPLRISRHSPMQECRDGDLKTFRLGIERHLKIVYAVLSLLTLTPYGGIIWYPIVF